MDDYDLKHRIRLEDLTEEKVFVTEVNFTLKDVELTFRGMFGTPNHFKYGQAIGDVDLVVITEYGEEKVEVKGWRNLREKGE